MLSWSGNARRPMYVQGMALRLGVLLLAVTMLVLPAWSYEVQYPRQGKAAPNGGQRAGAITTVILPGGVSMDFVWCPAGSFSMGSPDSEAGRSRDEKQHKVRLTRGFWIAKYEVTQKQYGALSASDSSRGNVAYDPVAMVSWFEAQAFCQKVNERAKLLPAGFTCALPTEAQWEYACRAGESSDKSNGCVRPTVVEGNAPLFSELAWYSENATGEAHRVGEKSPNAWGLYDMQGNVREWCRDWYGDYPATDVIDPLGPSSGSGRVNRGGSFSFAAEYCRPAARDLNSADKRGGDLGFRPVLVQQQESK